MSEQPSKPASNGESQSPTANASLTRVETIVRLYAKNKTVYKARMDKETASFEQNLAKLTEEYNVIKYRLHNQEEKVNDQLKFHLEKALQTVEEPTMLPAHINDHPLLQCHTVISNAETQHVCNTMEPEFAHIDVMDVHLDFVLFSLLLCPFVWRSRGRHEFCY